MNSFLRIATAHIFIFALYVASVPTCSASDWDESPADSSKPMQKSIGTNGETKFVLRGQIEHSAKLPDLGDGMQAGSNFNPQSLSHGKYASSWFKIPNWFAGSFESRDSTCEYMKDYVTGKTSRPNRTVPNVGEELYGFQKDAQGNIWHFYVESGTSQSDQQSYYTYNIIDWYGPKVVTDTRVVLEIRATSLLVDKRTGVIMDSFQREDIKTYEPAGKGSMKVYFTSKSFDSHGMPRDLQNGFSMHRQTAPFREIDQAGGQNYRQMFKDYLTREGQSALIPAN